MIIFLLGQGLTWRIVPEVGILDEGGSAAVAITGDLNSNLNGLTRAQFRAVSLKSGHSSVAMVNTTFYFCEAVRLRYAVVLL